MNTVLDSLLNIFFPSRCPLCGSNSDRARYNPICTSCWDSMGKYSGPVCGICGIPTVSSFTTVCGSCIKSRPPFSGMLFYGAYEGALKKSIHLLKFSGVRRLSKPLGLLLSELPVPEADGIIPVPLHPERLRQREFNQTALIARNLSQKLRIPLALNALIKIKETSPQTGIPGTERLKNVKNAYSASTEKVSGRDLLLIDDVITTGATVSECSRVLMKAGAKKVTIIALARSMPKQLC